MYNPKKIEKKWQKYWEEQGLHQAKAGKNKVFTKLKIFLESPKNIF